MNLAALFPYIVTVCHENTLLSHSEIHNNSIPYGTVITQNGQHEQVMQSGSSNIKSLGTQRNIFVKFFLLEVCYCQQSSSHAVTMSGCDGGK